MTNVGGGKNSLLSKKEISETRRIDNNLCVCVCSYVASEHEKFNSYSCLKDLPGKKLGTNKNSWFLCALFDVFEFNGD